jgi:hypothetical protein
LILYLSGNFPQLSNINKERAMAIFCEEKAQGYHRLMTFYYMKDCKTILSIGRELTNKPKKRIMR